MKDLRTIRIFLAVIFFAASAAYLFIGRGVNPMAQAAMHVQIIPSALAATIGATGFWLVATFMFGRIYCSTVCPVGTWQDSAVRIRRLLRRCADRSRSRSAARLLPPFSYRPRWRWRPLVLIAYLVCLILGLFAVAALLEPWRIMQAAASAVNPDAADPSLRLFAGNAILGTVIAGATLLAIWIWALLRGRRFCTDVCPIGTLLGCVSEHSVYHIEIDPDRCVNCMRCEEACRSEAIKVVGRHVDNARCVRCFDCLKVCPNYAIRFQHNRNRRATPLLRRQPDPNS